MSEEPPSPRLLNAHQRLIVGFVITMFAVAGLIALGIYAMIVLGQLVGYFSSVLWPLAVAGVLALVLRPVVEVLEIRFKLHRSIGVVSLYCVFVALTALALLVAVPPLVEQLLNFIASLPELRITTMNYFEQHYPQWSVTVREKMENPFIRNLVNSLAESGKSLVAHTMPTLRSAGGGLLDVFAFIAHLAIIPVYLFFFLHVRGEPTKSLPGHLSFLRPSVRDDLVFLVREFISIIESFFRGQMIIGLIMGVLLGIGFSIVGLEFGFVIGLILGVLNIIPYLGTIIGLAITLPLALLQPDGGLNLVMLVLLVKMIVQAVESWLLTPRIMGSRTGLHPVMIIVAIFFWGTAFHGVLGMLLAIPLTAFFVTAWRLAKWKYFTAKADVVAA